jgi:thiol-disulfide isomerase/thioredoxin
MTAFVVLLACLVMGAAGTAVAQREEPALSRTLTRLDPAVAAPDFRLEDMDGEWHTLGDYRGKVVLVNFWATWCPPCRREMPSLERLYQALRDQPFVVLAINQWENADHVFSFMGQLNVFPTFPILFDPESRVAEDFGVKGLPTSFVIDRQGRVVYRAVGGRAFDHPEIERVLRALLE